jgi:hypothetical protein
MTLSIMAECSYAVSFKLIVAFNPFMLSVVMLSVVMPNVIMPTVVMLSVVVLSVVEPSQ